MASRSPLSVRLLALMFSLVGFLPNPAKAQCQNQTCSWINSCFICAFVDGEYCSTFGRCPKQCTKGVCDDPSSTSSSDVQNGITSSSDQGCLAQAREKSSQPLKPFVGTAVLTSWQEQSPVMLQEFTVAVDDKAENFILKRIVLRNTSDVPVASYRLGWVLVYADAERKPDVGLGTGVTLTVPIEPNSKGEYRDNLVAKIPFNTTVKAVSFFLADVQLQDNRIFHEDLDRIASSTHDHVLPPKQD